MVKFKLELTKVRLSGKYREIEVLHVLFYTQNFLKPETCLGRCLILSDIFRPTLLDIAAICAVQWFLFASSGICQREAYTNCNVLHESSSTVYHRHWLIPQISLLNFIPNCEIRMYRIRCTGISVSLLTRAIVYVRILERNKQFHFAHHIFTADVTHVLRLQKSFYRPLSTDNIGRFIVSRYSVRFIFEKYCKWTILWWEIGKRLWLTLKLVFLCKWSWLQFL